MRPIEQLKEVLLNGTFHHATYRDQGTLWEGLHFYIFDPTGFRGFRHAGIVPKDDPDLDEAFGLVKDTGISVGAYGQG